MNHNFKFYKKFESPEEKEYIRAIKKCYPDWQLVGGPYCPGIQGGLTYKIKRNHEEKLVHCMDETYTVLENI